MDISIRGTDITPEKRPVKWYEIRRHLDLPIRMDVEAGVHDRTFDSVEYPL